MSSSYVHGTGSVPLLGETIGASLDRIAARFGDRDALISCHQKLRYTYAQLLDEVNRAARGLLALGVERGDRVGIWSGNAAEWVITQYAAAKVGAILVNINPAYRLRELEYALKQSGISVLVTARTFRKTDYVEMLVALAPELTAARDQPLALAKVPSLRHVIYLGEDGTPGGVSWLAFMRRGEQMPLSTLNAIAETLQFDDAANIQYTSGTTGSPKGATLSHHNILNNGFFVGEVLRYSADDRICAPVPFYHCFGCVMANLAALTHGAAVIVPAESFDPEATLRAIEAHRCTSIYGVPTMFIAMLSHPAIGGIRLDSLRTGIMAGAPCPIEVMRQVIDRMHVREVTICYGMTETSPCLVPVGRRRPIDGGCRPSASSPAPRVQDHRPRTGARASGTPASCARGLLGDARLLGQRRRDRAAIDAAGWMHTATSP
jgi:fatty-acyl-CoA synthase